MSVICWRARLRKLSLAMRALVSSSIAGAFLPLARSSEWQNWHVARPHQVSARGVGLAMPQTAQCEGRVGRRFRRTRATPSPTAAERASSSATGAVWGEGDRTFASDESASKLLMEGLPLRRRLLRVRVPPSFPRRELLELLGLLEHLDLPRQSMPALLVDVTAP